MKIEPNRHQKENRKMRVTKLKNLVILLVLVVFAAACAQQPAAETPQPQAATDTPAEVQPSPEPAELVDVRLTLNFLAGGPQAGFMYAKELGYYEELGLNVIIEEGQGSATTAQLVATGGAQIGFADGPAAMQVRSQGGDVKIIAPILQTNGFALISLKETGIESVDDLRGKTLAVQPGTAQATLLEAVFEANNLPRDEVTVTNIDPAALVGSLLEGRVDAILAGADFQSVQIRDRGFEINEQFYRDIGIPTVGLSIIANDQMIQDQPDVLRRFVEASLRGWDAARQNPQAAAQAVVDQFQVADQEQILKQLEIDLLLVCAPGAETLGAPPEENWEITYQLMTEYLDFPTDRPITDYYTTEFIPADAPRCDTGMAQPAPEPTRPAQMDEVRLTLNFLAGGPQAGFMYAKELGYYEELGLNVIIEEGQGSATTAQLVATGGAQIGFADGPAAMQVRSLGGDVKIIAPILQTNGFALISLKETGIESVDDLRGKTLAVQPGTAQATLLEAVFEANNLPRDEVTVTNIDPAALVGSLLEGRVDAILAGADFQSVQIRDRGFEINEQFYRDIGIPTVGLSIIANDQMIQDQPDVLRRFVEASLRGWDAARQNPQAAAQAVVDQFQVADQEQILKQLEIDLLLVCAPGAETLGAPPEENWEITYQLMTEYLDFPTDRPITDYYTTEFIPSDAPRCP
jgi:NitT/TauT family transport system substrate-binding protein